MVEWPTLGGRLNTPSFPYFWRGPDSHQLGHVRGGHGYQYRSLADQLRRCAHHIIFEAQVLAHKDVRKRIGYRNGFGLRCRAAVSD